MTLFVNKQDIEREKIQDQEYRLRYMRRCELGKAYPIRLSPLLQYEHKDREPALFTRKYPVTTLILMFFLFAFLGWCWEVMLYLVTSATFVNRGVMHGPWLPIYGTGGVLVLMVLYKLRDKPWLEFTATVVVCGIVEYFTAYYLETVYNRRWWDYAGISSICMGASARRGCWCSVWAAWQSCILSRRCLITCCIASSGER